MQRNRLERAGYAVPLAWILTLLFLADMLSPWIRLVAATAALLVSINIGAVLVLRGHSMGSPTQSAPTEGIE
jgi:hypothetical protein